MEGYKMISKFEMAMICTVFYLIIVNVLFGWGS
jgi:hypothetical protein